MLHRHFKKQSIYYHRYEFKTTWSSGLSHIWIQAFFGDISNPLNYDIAELKKMEKSSEERGTSGNFFKLNTYEILYEINNIKY